MLDPNKGVGCLARGAWVLRSVSTRTSLVSMTAPGGGCCGNGVGMGTCGIRYLKFKES